MQQIRGQSATATCLFFSPLLACLRTPYPGEPQDLLLRRGLGQDGVGGLRICSAFTNGGERAEGEASRSLFSSCFPLR